jgi:hypothetical protein
MSEKDNLMDFSLFTILAMENQDTEWIYQTDGVCFRILKRLFEKRVQPKEAAKICDRFYQMYVI